LFSHPPSVPSLPPAGYSLSNINHYFYFFVLGDHNHSAYNVQYISHYTVFLPFHVLVLSDYPPQTLTDCNHVIVQFFLNLILYILVDQKKIKYFQKLFPDPVIARSSFFFDIYKLDCYLYQLKTQLRKLLYKVFEKLRIVKHSLLPRQVLQNLLDTHLNLIFTFLFGHYFLVNLKDRKYNLFQCHEHCPIICFVAETQTYLQTFL